MKKIRLLAATSLLFGLILPFNSIANAQSILVKENKNSSVYKFTAKTVAGKSFDGSTLAGKPSVLWFWAPWCTVCRAESPDLIALSKAYKGKINIIGVASLGPVSDMKKFVTETRTGSFAHIADPKGEIWSRFNIVSQPSFIFISKSGDAYRVVGSPPKKDLFSLTDDIIKKV